MRVAIASGKGGTGKTTVAVNLARVMTPPVTLMDCDVEEPNSHIFLKPVIEQTTPVPIPVPQIDEALCTHCGECADFCQFNALADMKKKIVVFPELCHGCGGCTRVCPAGAIQEVDRNIGEVERGTSETGVEVITGRIRVGEALSPPLIRGVRNQPVSNDVIIDAPPGTACPFAAAVRGADLVVLVTEPTPFGLHDLTLAADTLKAMNLPFGVVINRSGDGDGDVESFCVKRSVPLLARIPEDRSIAEVYSRGGVVVDELPEYREVFSQLARKIGEMVAHSSEEVKHG